ncbi:MAG: YhgE/Pip family protein [Bacillaceae bacterium]
MKQILSIYKRDMKGIFTNIIATIVIVALMILPSLYAWFNIKSSWDPYGNTKGIKIAVVNLDKGTTLKDKSINIGDKVVEELKLNKQLGWVFVSKEKAEKGIIHGDYYASITIPSDFSEKLFTVITKNIQKPELIYTVNEKINAVAPKITEKGATSLQDTISSNVIKSASEAIFTIFNALGVEIESNLPDIEKFVHVVLKTNEEFPKAKELLQSGLQTAKEAQTIITNISESVTKFQTMSTSIIDTIQDINKLVAKMQTTFNQISPFLKEQLSLVESSAASIEKITNSMLGVANNPEAIKISLNQLSTKVETILTLSSTLLDTLEAINKIKPSSALQNEINKLQTITTHLTNMESKINSLLNDINNNKPINTDFLKNLNQSAANIGSISTGILNNYDSTIAPAFSNILQKAEGITSDTASFIKELKEIAPKLQDILKKISETTTITIEKVEKVQQDLPLIQQKLSNLAEKVKGLENQKELQDFVNLLRNDVQKEKDFFAQPVNLKEERLFKIPNYGSSMSPFFTTLSLWVGALLLVSMLSVDVHKPFKSYQIYFGRLLTFLTIAFFQGLIVTCGDLFILHTYVVHPFPFVLSGMIIALIFTFIVYTLVSVFGNVGKAIGVIFLVLQISASGGTFPIQVTPPFFQTINPFLPFTYAISMMRETVGGIVQSIVVTDMIILLLFTAIFLLIGLTLKKPLNKSTERFVEKAKKSGIFE